MPVDPNEPTYCICHQVHAYLARVPCLLIVSQVSYGEMIGCDNKHVRVPSVQPAIIASVGSYSALPVSFGMVPLRVRWLN
jgi:hypothetical protein